MKDHQLEYYLEDLNRLNELNFDQLNDWILRYPYCQNLHFLKAKKYQMEGRTDDLEVFHKAAFYSPDRSVLYEKLVNSEVEKSQFLEMYQLQKLKEKEEKKIKKEKKESKKELRSLKDPFIDPDQIKNQVSEDQNIISEESTVAPTPEIKEAETSPVVIPANELEVDKSNEVTIDVKEKKTAKKKLTELNKKNKKNKKGKKGEKKTKTKNKKNKKGEKKTKTENKKVKKGKRKKKDKKKKDKKKKAKRVKENDVENFVIGELVPKSEFSQWLLGLKSSSETDDLIGVKKTQSKKKKKNQKKGKKDNVGDSLKLQEDIISEPLAALLATQGHVVKAIEMYKKLSLKNPGKSTFFASQIDKLRK